jgi:PAS domain S-box-containing protein
VDWPWRLRHADVVRLSELLDMPLVQRLAEANYHASGMPIGVIDAVDGSVLVGFGWQDICVMFHRANAVTLQRCHESDDHIKAHLSESEPCEYRCKNGLRDIGVPIVVAGQHLATLFLGQFFYEGEAPDRQFFVAQAHSVGFDEGSYLAALDRVPTFTRAQVANIVRYNQALARFVSELAERMLVHMKDEEALRGSEERLRAVADSIPHLAWTARPDGFITWYNRRWYEYTGTTPQQMEGWGWQSVHDPALLPEVLRRWKDSIATASAFEMEFPLRAADGSFRRFLTRGFPLKDASGSVLQWFGTNTDVTELMEAQEALRDADRRKSDFLAVLAHELRNPLAPIRNSVELLRRADARADVARRAIEVIDRQAAHLARLVEDLLDVSRITRGKVRLEKQVVRMAEVVSCTVDDHRALLARKQVALRFHPGAEPTWVEVDTARLGQIVGNLLQNAAKFTHASGSVDVSVGTDGGRAVLRVRDDGIGMDETTISRLFEPFMQANVTLDRTQGGLGLGLALARELVEMHGGTIHASSPGLGKGAEFTVSLPLAHPPDTAASPAATAATRTPLRVLVIEDNEDAAASLCDLLELEGHRVDVAHDGQQGLDAAVAGAPDVVVCDIGLPLLDGYEVARRLRAAGSRARLLALTGYAAAEDVERSRAAGFDEHLAKPPDPERLLALLAPRPTT